MQDVAALQLKDIMTPDVLQVQAASTIDAAARLMVERHVSCLLVQDGRHAVGILTERDIAAHGRQGDLQAAVSQIMRSPVITAQPDMPFTDAYEHMLGHRIRHLVAVDSEGDVCGIASESDFRTHIAGALMCQVDDIQFVMDRSLCVTTPGSSLTDALDTMIGHGASYVLVRDEGAAAALFSERDLINALTSLPAGRSPRAATLRQFIGPRPVCVPHNTTVAEASIKMDALRVRHLGVQNDQGHIVGVMSQTDVMERLRPALLLDAAMRERETLSLEKNRALGSLQALREAIDQADDGIATCDLGGLVQHANRAWAHMHGTTLDKVIGKHIGQFHTADQLRCGGEPDLTLLARLGTQHAEVGHIHRDGSRFTTAMTTTALRLDDGSLGGYIRVARNITEARQTREQLRHSELRFRRMLQSAPLAMAYFDADGTFSFRNERFIALFGYTEQDALTVRQWMQLAFPDRIYGRQLMARLNAAIQEARAMDCDMPPLECRITCKDGTVKNIEYAGILLDGDTLAIFVDVTARAAATQAQHAHQEQLETQVKQRTALLEAANASLLLAKDAAEAAFWFSAHLYKTPVSPQGASPPSAMDVPAPAPEPALTLACTGRRVLLAENPPKGETPWSEALALCQTLNALLTVDDARAVPVWHASKAALQAAFGPAADTVGRMIEARAFGDAMNGLQSLMAAAELPDYAFDEADAPLEPDALHR